MKAFIWQNIIHVFHNFGNNFDDNNEKKCLFHRASNI